MVLKNLEGTKNFKKNYLIKFFTTSVLGVINNLEKLFYQTNLFGKMRKTIEIMN